MCLTWSCQLPGSSLVMLVTMAFLAIMGNDWGVWICPLDESKRDLKMVNVRVTIPK